MSTIPPVSVRYLDGVFVVKLDSSFSDLYAGSLDQIQILTALADSAEPARIVVDMTNVEVMGSATISLLMTAARKLINRQGAIALANLSRFCLAAINTTCPDSMLPTFDSTAAAIAEISTD